MANTKMKIQELTLDYSEYGDGSEMAESVIFEDDIELFEKYLSDLKMNYIGYDELEGGRVKMIHEEYY